MRILGIHDGHNATACLLDDGTIVAMASEERWSRRKNQSGFPRQAVAWILDAFGVDPCTLDAVAVAGLVPSMQEFGVHEGPWYGLAAALSRVVPPGILGSRATTATYRALRGRSRLVQLTRHLAPFGIDPRRIRLVEHHTCHAHAAYWLDRRRRPEPTLVVTLDNTGDGLCGSVSLAKGQTFQRLAAFPSLHSIGMMYTAVTRYLGLKPVEDEHKVMGLAPYARGAAADAVYRILRRHIDLSADHCAMVNRSGLWEDAYVRRFQSELASFRFDHVAAGVQRLLEELVVPLLRAWSRRTGVRKLALGGGVFMNVKLNMLVDADPAFDEVYVLPSCGDESLAAGAALYTAWELHRTAARSFDPSPLGPLYLGPGFSNDEVAQALEPYRARLRWRRSEDIERELAHYLAADFLVGGLAGRMEFGARALGNRSILARADSLNTVRRLNAAIKMRDFWMPFAPAILWERRHDYIVNMKDSPAPYMILAFPSTSLAARELIAALHPFDLSCRPQVVDPELNPRFHRLLKEYEKRTGCGGLLNTSFNLHGEPIVRTPQDAIETYLRSDLDVLAMEDYVVWDPARLANRVGANLLVAPPASSSPRRSP
jgi:carbamoyltransferase